MLRAVSDDVEGLGCWVGLVTVVRSALEEVCMLGNEICNESTEHNLLSSYVPQQR